MVRRMPWLLVALLLAAVLAVAIARRPRRSVAPPSAAVEATGGTVARWIGLASSAPAAWLRSALGVAALQERLRAQSSAMAALAQLSIARPMPLPGAAPSGQDARELPSDQYVGHPEYGIDPRTVVQIFMAAEQGDPTQQCDLIDGLVEGDCTLRSLFEQRAQAVAGKPYSVQAGGGQPGDALAARVLAEALRRLPLVEFFEHQLAYNRHGWAATEIDWGVMIFEGRSYVVPVHLANVEPRRFKIDVKRNELLLVTEAKPRGEPLRPGKWVVTKRPGRLARAGLMRTGAWAACYKRYGTRDWVVYAQRFGVPLVVIQYEDGVSGGATADKATRALCETVAKNIGNDGAAVLPSSVKVEIKEAGRDGDSAAVHGGLIAYCNAELGKLVNGSTLTNDNSGGSSSYALGAVHADVRWDNVQYDAARLAESFLTQIATPFVAFNGLAAAAPLLHLQVVRDLAPEARARVAATWVNDLGGRASAQQLGEELGFRAPINEGDELGGRETAPSPAPIRKVA